MRRMKILVTLDALHKQPAEVPFWELPILRHIHGDASVVELGEMRCDQRVPPPDMEYLRLEKRYGVNKDTRVPRVAELFGAGQTGVDRLAEAMRDDIEEQRAFDERDAQAAEEAAAKEATPTQGVAGLEPIAGAVVNERERQRGKRASAS